MGLHFDIVDVFTERPYAGNPLAVVHRARTLTARQMQALAAEFGFSETAFTLPPTTSRATYRVRIFTPTRELPFAGHPSIGAAWALGFADMIRIGDVVQECGAGLLPVHVDRDGARLVGGTPVVGPDLDGAQLAATVGLAADDLDPALPAGIASAGVPFAFLAVRPEAVARAVPDAAAVAACHGGADRARRGGGRPREGHGAPADVRPAGRRQRGPGDGLGGGRARRPPRRARGAARGPVGALDRAGRRDRAALDLDGAGATWPAGPRRRSRCRAGCGWWRRASCWRCRSRRH